MLERGRDRGEECYGGERQRGGVLWRGDTDLRIIITTFMAAVLKYNTSLQLKPSQSHSSTPCALHLPGHRPSTLIAALTWFSQSQCYHTHQSPLVTVLPHPPVPSCHSVTSPLLSQCYQSPLVTVLPHPPVPSCHSVTSPLLSQCYHTHQSPLVTVLPHPPVPSCHSVTSPHLPQCYQSPFVTVLPHPPVPLVTVLPHPSVPSCHIVTSPLLSQCYQSPLVTVLPHPPVPS